MRPRAGLLAGEEGARGGVVVGDGGTGVRGGTKLRGFRRGVNDSEQMGVFNSPSRRINL